MKVVYKIVNKINKKIYIGSSINFKKRKRCHISKLKRNIHENPHLQNSVNKYGIENFEINIIEKVETDILEREQFYINKYRSYDNEIGFNILKDTGFTWTGSKHRSNTIEKMSKSKLGKKNPMYGRGKPILQLDLDGNIINEFISVRQAAEFLGVKQKTIKKNNRNNRTVFVTQPIKRCLNGKRPTGYGFKWKYKQT